MSERNVRVGTQAFTTPVHLTRADSTVLSTRLAKSALSALRERAASSGETLSQHVRTMLLAANDAAASGDDAAAMAVLRELLGLSDDASTDEIVAAVQSLIGESATPADSAPADALGDNGDAPAQTFASAPKPFTERELAGARKLGITPAEFRRRKELAVRTEAATSAPSPREITDRDREGAKKLSRKLGREVSPAEFAQMKRDAVRRT